MHITHSIIIDAITEYTLVMTVINSYFDGPMAGFNVTTY